MTDELKQVELTMHLFRLARSGNFRTGEEVLKAAREDFPEASEDEIRAAMNKLARRLYDVPD